MIQVFYMQSNIYWIIPEKPCSTNNISDYVKLPYPHYEISESNKVDRDQPNAEIIITEKEDKKEKSE